MLLLPVLLHLLLSHAAASGAGAAIPDPGDLLLPTSPSPTSSSPATIPAFPDAASAAAAGAIGAADCPLSAAASILPFVASSCAPNGLPSRGRCCPALAAWLYAARAAALLAPRPAGLPVPPDDSEACAGAAESALRASGIKLPRANETCDAALCYCGLRLRRPVCASGSDGGGARWQPPPANARRIESECALPGLNGCSRCLRALNELNGNGSNNNNITMTTEASKGGAHKQDCHVMGLTWLLDMNGTRYLPAAAGVLQTLMASAANSKPIVCSIPTDDLPIAAAADSSMIKTVSAAAAATLRTSWPSLAAALLPAVVAVVQSHFAPV